MDQLASYEPNPDMLHYTTRFIDGLKHDARLIVAVQRPVDLDTAYAIAVVQEEVEDDDQDYSHFQSRRSQFVSKDKQYKAHVPRQPDDVRTADTDRHLAEPDKLATLKAYRRAKGLCFVCGERWGRDHKCNATVQLHVVQEMLEFCKSELSDSDDSVDDLMVLSAETQKATNDTSAIRLKCQIAGLDAIFLLDSGSSHSFVSTRLAQHLPGKQALPKQQRVRIAGGGHLVCDQMIPNCPWSANGYQFQSQFKILPLKFYDGIIGMDWLSCRGTMKVNWQHKWLSFDEQGKQVFLQGEPPVNFAYIVVELRLAQSQPP